MFNAAYKASNGVMVQSIDMGVQYMHNGHTMVVVGEQQQGEIDVDAPAVETEHVEGVNVEFIGAEAVATIGNTEEDYEAYALQVLQSL